MVPRHVKHLNFVGTRILCMQWGQNMNTAYYRVFQVSCLLKNRHISASWAARDLIETSVRGILKTVLYLPLHYVLVIILLCVFQFCCQDGIFSYCSILINAYIGTKFWDELSQKSLNCFKIWAFGSFQFNSSRNCIFINKFT